MELGGPTGLSAVPTMVRSGASDPQQTELVLPFSRAHAELVRERLVGETGFLLLEDPRRTRKAAVVGMMVLRPLSRACVVGPGTSAQVDCLFDSSLDWVYNCRLPGLAGGGPLANGSVFDAYRLAVQYACSDAVMIGSVTVACEGLGSAGYCWQAWMPCSWPHLSEAFGSKQLEHALRETRREWQRAGLLSERSHPAQIVVSASGNALHEKQDFLDARVFSETHADSGAPYECYILTSLAGAGRIRNRALAKGWTAEKIEATLLVCAHPESSERIDVARVPTLLYDELGMRIVNHDGGATVLRDFARAGALTQINMSLGLKVALCDTERVRTALHRQAEAAELAEVEELKGEKVVGVLSLLGHEGDRGEKVPSSDSTAAENFEFFWGCRSWPPRLRERVAALIIDKPQELAVCVLDLRGGVELDDYDTAV